MTETVSFSDFAKLELRIGKIMAVEPVEGTDKLYKLSVRLGEETRTLVAGLAESYAADELMGMKIVVVANLEPKSLKGIESQGMLLAADENGTPVLLTPEKDVSDGTPIR
ncbi:hypothetical protein KJ765_05325 [Candidatus Micrarchaeota archaeon]|nr:hypothetical protein [Candidatus Micrarchaeota archaeon]